MIPEILVGKRQVLLFVVSVLLSRPLGLWQTRDGKPRILVGIVCWAIALVVLLANVLATEIDDEVLWLINAWGQANGTLFLRVALFKPFLALGLAPSATIMAGRACVAALAVICAWLAASMARRMGQSALVSMLIGPVLLLCFARGAHHTSMQMVFLRPEYFAFAFFAFGLWALLTPPTSWSRQTSVFLGFAFLTLCASTSLRQFLFPAGALACVLLYPGKISRGAAAKWAILGGLVGLAPTALWMIFTDSIKAVYYWHVVFPKQAQWLYPSGPLSVSTVLLGLALAGCFYLWPREENRSFSRTLIILWITATALAMSNPLKMGYSLGPWLTLSTLIGGAFLSALPNREPGLSQTRWTIIAFSLMGLPLLAAHATDYGSPRGVLAAFRQCGSQLRLIDWIDQTRGGGPVICVVPYHPIRAANVWKMSNAWWYASMSVRSLLLELDPDIESKLRSCKAAVIQWDPCPKWSRNDNVMQFWARWGFIPPGRTDEMARRLAHRYVPVHWDGPLPALGGSVFLVRKDLKLAPGVTVLDARVILDWRKKTR